LISVAKNVGANRIIPGAGVPHVLGNPLLKPEMEMHLRRKIVEQALNIMTTQTKNEFKMEQVIQNNSISSL
jgi:glycine reductase